MRRKNLKNSYFFRRIGNAYNNLIDREHFMGRSPFEDTWLSPTKKKKTIDSGDADQEYLS